MVYNRLSKKRMVYSPIMYEMHYGWLMGFVVRRNAKSTLYL